VIPFGFVIGSLRKIIPVRSGGKERGRLEHCKSVRVIFGGFCVLQLALVCLHHVSEFLISVSSDEFMVESFSLSYPLSKDESYLLTTSCTSLTKRIWVPFPTFFFVHSHYYPSWPETFIYISILTSFILRSCCFWSWSWFLPCMRGHWCRSF